MGRFAEQRAFLKTDFSLLKDIQTGAKKGESQPPREKAIPQNAETIVLPLPDGKCISKSNVFECIKNRKSVRKYVDKALSLEELSYLLWASQGVTEIQSNGKAKRTVPSAGATYTFESYLFIQNVETLKQGIYRYLPFQNKLVLIKPVEDIARLINEVTAAEKQPFLPYFAGKANVIFAWSTIPYRSEWKFDIQAHKKILIDAGHVCQNLYIAGESIDTGICAIGIYDQNAIDNVLGLDGDEELVIYLAAAGKNITSAY